MSVQALRNWEVEGKIMPSHRTPGGQRMSDLAELLGVNDLTYPTIAYARVSSVLSTLKLRVVSVVGNQSSLLQRELFCRSDLRIATFTRKISVDTPLVLIKRKI